MSEREVRGSSRVTGGLAGISVSECATKVPSAPYIGRSRHVSFRVEDVW